MEMEVVNDDKELEVSRPKDLAIQSETGALLKMAVDKDLDIGKLEKLIELKNREEERACKRDFELHFTQMKAELPIIEKDTEAKDQNGKTMYKFAKLESLQEACDPIITTHGFCYHWDESHVEATKSKRITFFLSGYGHTRSNYFDSPEIPSNKFANAIQTAGIQASFGKRYSMIEGLGLIVKGVDNDANHLTFNDAIEYADQIVWLKSCNTPEDLKGVWSKIYQELKKNNDSIGRAVLTEVYNKQKEAVLNGTV